MTRILLTLPALLLSLAACQPVVVLPTEPDGGIGDTPDACGASGLQQFVGQPPSALDAVRFSQPFRIIRPGEMVTMDYLAERVNFRVDESGRIAEVTCG